MSKNKAYVYPKPGVLVVEDGLVKVRWETPKRKYELYFSSPWNFTTYVTHKDKKSFVEEE